MVNQTMLGLGTARSVIRELFEYGKQRAAIVGAENVFDFSIGNPSVPAPPQVNETAIAILAHDDKNVHGYTSAQGDIGARTMLIENLNRRFGTSYSPDQMYLTVGAAAALCCTLQALACPEDEVIVFAPYFPEYRVFVAASGYKMVEMAPEIDAFQIDFDAFQQAITPHTKAVIVNSPNNPSGVIYSVETVEKLSALLRAKSAEYGHPIYLISDEPYREIVFSDCAVPWLPDYYDSTIVCYSFSKSLSMPGERIGYVLVPPQVCDSADVYAAVAGAGRSLGYVNAPSLFQQVVAQCCDLTSDISIYERNANLLVPALRKMGYHVIEPNGAFYLFRRTPEADDMAFAQRAMKYDLLLVPGSGFGAPGHARLAFCVQTEMIERALPKLEELFKSYQ